jgi:5-methylcytosine-specific restriction endonuclease McrA
MGSVRDGHGHRAYRRKQDQLKRRTARENLVCGHGGDYGCGLPIDTTLPREHRMSFTADHPQAIKHGGHLVKQELVPMHKSCNSRKGDHATVEVWEAS